MINFSQYIDEAKRWLYGTPTPSLVLAQGCLNKYNLDDTTKLAIINGALADFVQDLLPKKEMLEDKEQKVNRFSKAVFCEKIANKVDGLSISLITAVVDFLIANNFVAEHPYSAYLYNKLRRMPNSPLTL
jgi:RPA family protein